MRDQDFDAEKRRGMVFFYATAAIAAVRTKDFCSSINFLKTIQSLDGYDAFVELKTQAIPN